MWYKLQVPAHRKLRLKDQKFKASLIGWPQTHCVAKDALELLALLSPRSPSWVTGKHLYAWLTCHWESNQSFVPAWQTLTK